MQVTLDLPDELIAQMVKEAVAEKRITSPPLSEGFKVNMNKGEASEYIGVSRNTLDDLIKQGLPASKFGSRWILNKHKIDQWLADQQHN